MKVVRQVRQCVIVGSVQENMEENVEFWFWANNSLSIFLILYWEKLNLLFEIESLSS